MRITSTTGDRLMVKIVIRQDNGKERVVGHYDPATQSLFVTRKRSKHFMRKLNAWGLDEKVFRGLKDKGLQYVVLTETEERKKYRATVKAFCDYGEYLHVKPYRLQIFLEQSYWSVCE